MPNSTGLYDIRDGCHGDRAFILATFLRGLYYGDSWFGLIPKAIFMENYSKIANAMLDNPNIVVKVACDKQDAEIIYGYSILSSDYQTVAWVQVKKAFRGQGIARALVPTHPTQVTHLSALGLKLLPKLNNAVFNPFFIP